ncbi:MAG TPA: cytosine permease [Microbacterium sp.]|uniref:purine-cytosine permease family protein n=1 Tax=Microbacterium sp. TaxID=51671 RepID=UPI002B47AA34|nr:cytosine permease [Microbacterium sp.]HKT55704.1 cytosine permease [Microbacterium sp.]
MSTTTATSSRGLEVRSIDYVPLSERHGKVSHIGPLWFMSNAQIATLATGLISITSGGNLIWSFIAIALGILIGTFFMAAHSSQGPQLGLPQMIQSRPQFGYIGALLVWLFAYIQYAGFNIFNSVLAGEAVGGAISTKQAADPLWIWVVTIVAVVVALVGYDLIHSVERYLMYLTVIMLVLLTASAVIHLHVPASQFDLSHFQPVAFFGQLGVAAGYQISWAIYVSDYSRYLPRTTSTNSTFQWTFWGSALGGIWVMFLGSWIAVSAKDIGTNTVVDLKHVADLLFPGFGVIALIVAALGLVSVTALNMYGGSLTLISSIDSFVKVRPTLTIRIVTLVITAAISLAFALFATAHFLGNFNAFLLLILYLFIPWTAVNLTDFFIVRKGHYAIAEIFKPNGIYRRWGWPGIAAYVLGFVVMVPFFDVADFYEGPVSKAMGGVDISMFIGLPVAAVAYWLMTRHIDVAAEQALADTQAREIEEAAAHHELP